MDEPDLQSIANNDVKELVRKDAEYGGSWKRRGGAGAFMMLARKWDRLEEQAKKHNYDIFAAIKADPRDDGILDDIGDLARYLLLVRAEARSWSGPAKDKVGDFSICHHHRMTPNCPICNPVPVRKVPRPAVDGQQHPFGYDYKVGEDGA